jgi:hypothetical protein
MGRVWWCDGPIAVLECRKTSRLAIRVLVNTKANYGHIGDACEWKAVGWCTLWP